MSETLLECGRNCWRKARAERLAFLIDGEAYFGTLRRSLVEARERIDILAWDIDSRFSLLREGGDDGLPTALGPLLHALLERRPALRVRILLWDFSMIYALERDWTPVFAKPDWLRHPRLDFKMDDRLPVGASQHQKLVVVDGHLAYLGGFDPSKWRWDSPAHAPDDPRRVDPGGERYPPFHDLQVLVEGEAAEAAWGVFAERWERVTGEATREAPVREPAPWPEGLTPDLEDVEVAFSRTYPAHAGRAEVREVERLHLDAIAAARRTIYIENQYLTSAAVVDALGERLQAADGPQVVLVLPRETGGWLEQATMDVLRARALGRLRASDAHDRLRVYFPHRAGLGDERIIVHSKLLITDDRLLRVGSANTSNRSMGLDSELDIAIEAGDRGVADAIAGLRRRLLAEHLGATPAAVAEAEERGGGLIATIESLSGGDRCLRPLDGRVDEDLEREIPDDRLIDPERPRPPEELLTLFVGEEQRAPAGRRGLVVLLVIVALLAMAAAWRWTPLSEVLAPEAAAALLRGLGQHPLGGVVMVATFVAGSLVAVPVTLLFIVTGSVFGIWLGAAYGLAGAVAAAVVNYAIGSMMGRESLRRLGEGRINRLSRRLARRGVLAVIVLRVVPVAPFTVINLVAGASHIRFRDYLVGTIVGMAPGALALTAFADRLIAAIARPDLPTVAGFLAVAVVVIGVLWGLRRWARGRSADAR